MTDAQEFELQCSTMPSVTIYSDGSFKPDLNTGGYGTIMTCNGHSMFLYGGYINRSNNSMELEAVLVGLRMLNTPCRVNVISDSKYVVDGINSWMLHWQANGWRKSDGGPIKNEQLWRELHHFAQIHVLSAVWIKGHAGNFGNAICDQFASIAAYDVAGIPVPPHLIDIKRL